VRRALAVLSLAIVALNCVGLNRAAPARATGLDQPQGLDPRFVKLLNGHTCGGQPPAAQRFAGVNTLLAALPDPTDSPPTPHLEVEPLAELLAQAAQATATPSPVPTGLPTGSGGMPISNGDQSTALPAPPAPAPSPSASYIPIPGVPPAGPGEIVPPTPRASATVTPYPIASPSPATADTGPVFLVRPSGSPSPIPLAGSQTPGAEAPGPGASPIPTLGPNQVVTIADKLIGSSDRRAPSDLIGNVHIFYTEGQIVGDRAHFDGDHTIVVTGHTYLVNRSEDSILYADRISFDTLTRRAILYNGQGESIEGVQHGKLHFVAQQLTTRSNGTTHGDHASFTTCENQHAGYHVEAREIDVVPGDKLIARKAVVYLGPTAIFYLPLLVIPLLEVSDPRRQASFLPLVGYDSVEGFWIKARIGFGTTNTYYGYYRVEYYTRRGLGLGYTAYIGAKDAHRYTTIDAYTIDDRIEDARETNVNITDVETFSRRLRGQFGIQYQGDYGPSLSLPATLNLNASIIHQGNASTENVTFSRYVQGSLSDNLNIGFIDTITLSPNLQQQINLTYSKFNSPLSSSDTFHIETDTHLFTKLADYDLTYDKTDYSTDPFGYDSVPQLSILPHINYGASKFAPQFQLEAGDYTEPQNHFSAFRFQGQMNLPYYAKVFGNSDFSANYNITQDYYSTGDEKAFDIQNASLSTPLGQHFVNSVTYNEQHPIGPANVPFQLLDNLQSGSHGLQDVIRFYNKDVYSLSLSSGTDFNEQAQPINYQLNLQPSLKSYVVIGGYWTPGPGNGFGLTNVQAITPFGRDTSLELATNVNWKDKGQLEDKSIFLVRTIDDCYNLQLAYNQDLKQFTFNVVILAFPGQGAGFGIGGGQPSSVIPQGLTY
jgi:hypothetical protein